MPRIGLLGLEPFLVSQVERLDRNLEIVLLDAVDDDARENLDLAVVIVNREHAGAPRLLGAHPSPPVVVVDDGPDDRDDEGGGDQPLHLARPISSPDLLDAIDRSRGVSGLRRSLRGMTIEQDDAAIADRWAAVARTITALGTLAWGAINMDQVGVPVLVLLTAFAVGRSLWWRLSPALVAFDAVVAFTVLALASAAMEGSEIPLTMLAAAVALEAGFVVGLWGALSVAAVAVALLGAVWLVVLDRSVDEVFAMASSGLLVLTAVATGAMARRLWLDQTETRSSELRRFRSTLYDLSRRQAVVAVSFDVGTVAEDALARLIADTRPRAAMVLVADGAGPLQVAASHNLAAPPPARLTWQPGTQPSAGAAEFGPDSTPAPAADGDAPGTSSDGGGDQDVGDGPVGHPEVGGTSASAPDGAHVAASPARPAARILDLVDEPDSGLTARLMYRMQAARVQEGRSRPIREQADADRPTVSAPGRDDRAARASAARAAGTDPRALGPEARWLLADVGERTTIRSSQVPRLTSVLEQLAPSLPAGQVLVHGAELDGELMGALIVVSGDDTRSIPRHAEETALALDSVRLFNRLRAFTRDQERARIARSLHDGVMQTLAHVAFELDRVANDSWDDSQVDTLGRLRDHVLGTVDEMRTVVNDLRTVRLDRGLPAALEAMALTLSPAGGPVIEVTTGAVGSLPGDVEEQFLRIAEEALTNAVRYSGGRNVRLDLTRAHGALMLQVSDDGFGFTHSRVGESDGGVGLTSMYQRAKSIRAGLDIDTGANGTIITVHKSLVPTEVSAPPRRPTRVAHSRRRRRRWRRRR